MGEKIDTYMSDASKVLAGLTDASPEREAARAAKGLPSELTAQEKIGLGLVRDATDTEKTSLGFPAQARVRIAMPEKLFPPVKGAVRIDALSHDTRTLAEARDERKRIMQSIFNQEIEAIPEHKRHGLALGLLPAAESITLHAQVQAHQDRLTAREAAIDAAMSNDDVDKLEW